MKNTLLIVANPRKESLSFAIAGRYQALAAENGEAVELLDLYRDDHQQPFITFDHPYDREVTPQMRYYQEKIAKADTLVFVFPFWWGHMPAILKNFIDWNFTMGFAAEFVGSKPRGLLTDKKVRVISTCGSPTFLYYLNGARGRLKKMIKKELVEFCGMTMESFQLFGGVDTGKGRPEKILEEIRP